MKKTKKLKYNILELLKNNKMNKSVFRMTKMLPEEDIGDLWKFCKHNTLSDEFLNSYSRSNAEDEEFKMKVFKYYLKNL